MEIFPTLSGPPLYEVIYGSPTWVGKVGKLLEISSEKMEIVLLIKDGDRDYQVRFPAGQLREVKPS